MPSDRDAILKLMSDYAEHADTVRPREWSELFAPDGHLEAFGKKFGGHEKLARFISNAPQGKHGFDSAVIEIQGERARARSNFRFVANDPENHSKGVYHDEFVRSGGAWRFASRRVEFAARGPGALD
jgi:hypothetical protein